MHSARRQNLTSFAKMVALVQRCPRSGRPACRVGSIFLKLLAGRIKNSINYFPLIVIQTCRGNSQLQCPIHNA